jgi:hypothetical protein
MLLGLAAFLWFESRDRLALTGMCLTLAALKPQVVYLIFVAVFLDSLRPRK